VADQNAEIRARDARAANYEAWYRGRGWLFDQIERETIWQALDLQPGQTLWDAGSGTGRLAREAAPTASRVFATDFSPRSVEVLRSACAEGGITNVEAHVADLTGPPPFLDRVDRVLSVQTIQHLPTEEDRRTAVGHLHDRLNPGGRAVIVLYNWLRQQRQGLEKSGQNHEGIHYLRFTPEEAQGLMESAGFGQVTVRGSNHFLRMHHLRNTPLYGALRPLAWLDVQLSRAPGSARWGNFLVVTGVRGGAE